MVSYKYLNYGQIIVRWIVHYLIWLLFRCFWRYLIHFIIDPSWLCGTLFDPYSNHYSVYFAQLLAPSSKLLEFQECFWIIWQFCLLVSPTRLHTPRRGDPLTSQRSRPRAHARLPLASLEQPVRPRPRAPGRVRSGTTLLAWNEICTFSLVQLESSLTQGRLH